MNTPITSIRLQNKEKLAELAKKDNRSLANLINHIIAEYLKNER